MTGYIIQRLFYAIITFWVLSIVVFIVIQLPPGDFLTSYIQALQETGGVVDQAEIAALRQQYGLDAGPIEQYVRWFGKFLRGDMGRSFEWNQPVVALLQERLPYTILLSMLTLFFTYIVAVPIGIYVATRQYSFSDYLFTFVGLAGLATPNFLLALILMFLFFKYFGVSVGGLFSAEYALAPWSLAKLWDMIKHLWVPIIVIGTSGTAGIIRVMRGTLLDELGRQYVITARAKGVPEGKLLFKYPVRVAINPIVSTIGWQLPRIVSGETIVAIVLSLPTTGPLLFRSLLSQDMFMAGSIVMMLGILTLIGTFLSDILLVIVDPRIRYERKSQ
ncbi:MAG: ABC transporter permease [Caldilineaceae bacterium]